MVNKIRDGDGVSLKYNVIMYCVWFITGLLTSNRALKIGRSANTCIENNMRANTEMSSCKRDARTTEADMAAFMDRTDVNLLDVRKRR